MARRTKKNAGGTLQAGGYETEDVFADAEPWVPTETKLVVWSFAAAAVSLIVFGIIINCTILSR